MLRDIDLNEISDGRLYTANDMVKADCMGCQGCASCCQGMGDSIVLDPYDMYRLCMGLKTTPVALLASSLELGVVDGLILPHLKMNGNADSCMYLNKDLKPLQNYAMTSEDSEKIKALSIQILQTFYLLPYIEDVDFYEQFYQRLSK